MKFVTKYKSTSINKTTTPPTVKVKYFNDHIEATFTMDAGKGDGYDYNIEPITLIQEDDGSFYVIDPSKEKNQGDKIVIEPLNPEFEKIKADVYSALKKTKTNPATTTNSNSSKEEQSYLIVVPIVKSTAYKSPSSEKVKYFHNHIEAGYTIDSGIGTKYHFKTETIGVLKKGNGDYYLLEMSDACKKDVKSLPVNTMQKLYSVYEQDGEEGGEYGRTWGHNEFTSVKPDYYSANPEEVFLDENHIAYKVGQKIEIERPAEEFEKIKDVVYGALNNTKSRLVSEYKTNLANYKKSFEFFKQMQEGLRSAEDVLMIAEESMNISPKDRRQG